MKFVVVMLLTFAITLPLITSTGCSPCTDTALQRAINYKSGHTAILVESECGATTGFIRRIVLYKGISLYGTDGDTVTDTEGLGLSKLEWLGNKLIVSYDEKDTKFIVKENKRDNVVIEYKHK